MDREFPLLLIFSFPLLAGLACTFAGASFERRLGTSRFRNLLAYGRLGAHAMALFFSFQAYQAFAEPDPRALQQSFGAAISLGHLAADLGFLIDQLASRHVLVLMSIAVLDGFVEAVLAGRHRLVEAGRRSLLIALVVALMMADSLVGAVLAWVTIGPILLLDSRRRGERTPSSSRPARELLVSLEGVGLAAGLCWILVTESSVGAQQWDVIARAAFSTLRVEEALGSTVANVIVISCVTMICARVLGIGTRRIGNSALVCGAVGGLGAAYLAHRCLWLIGSAPQTRMNAIVAVALATAFSLAWAVVRDEPEGLPAGPRLARLRKRVSGTGTSLFGIPGRMLGAIAQLSRGLDIVLLDKAPSLVADLSQDARAGAAVLGRRMAIPRGIGARGTLGFLLGVGLVLGLLYFKPGVSSLLPNEIHGFGGLEPRIHRPTRPRKAGSGDQEAGKPTPRSRATVKIDKGASP
jgi:hypothetical protein